MPNPWLLAALATSVVAAIAWVCIVEPRLDARRDPGHQLTDELWDDFYSEGRK